MVLTAVLYLNYWTTCSGQFNRSSIAVSTSSPTIRAINPKELKPLNERLPAFFGYLRIKIRIFIAFMDMLLGMALKSDTLVISPQILAPIAETDEFKGAWKALGTLAPERLSALRHVATIESIGSSTRIEGSKLSDREIEQLLSNIEIQSFDSRDEQEVAGYAAVMESVFVRFGEIALTENHIKQLHRDLLIHSNKDERHRGEYKTHPNSVSGFDADGTEMGVIFETTTPFDTPRLMEELVEWTNTQLNEGELRPLFVIAIFIVVFLEIHPFQDGNGRLSRILTTLLLMQTGYAYVPYSSLESVIEQSKDAYYLALRKTQGTIRKDKPDWQPWVQFFLSALQQQKRRLEEKVKREKIMVEALPELSLEIMQLARDHGRLTNAQIVEATRANRNTVKKHLSALVASGQLEQHGTGKGTWYSRK